MSTHDSFPFEHTTLPTRLFSFGTHDSFPQKIKEILRKRNPLICILMGKESSVYISKEKSRQYTYPISIHIKEKVCIPRKKRISPWDAYTGNVQKLGVREEILFLRGMHTFSQISPWDAYTGNVRTGWIRPTVCFIFAGLFRKRAL